MSDQDTIATARFWAISGIGFGKGRTPGEAHENYVAAQLRNHPASSTIFKTKPAWEKALRTGEAKADIWLAPEGATGFFTDGRVYWTFEDGHHEPAIGSERLTQEYGCIEEIDLIRRAAMHFLHSEDPESLDLGELADALGVKREDVEAL